MKNPSISKGLWITGLILMGLISLMAKAALAQEAPKPSLQAISAFKQTIRIDGLLDEAVWQMGKAAAGFIQQEPNVGKAAAADTHVRLAYDHEHLYIAAWLKHPEPLQIRADERQRDAQLNRSDAFAVLIDTYHDHQNGYFFETNPLGAMSDAIVNQEGDEINRDWDGIWEVSARQNDRGWSAEFKIPFKQLRFRQGDSQMWGIQFRRRVPHLKEISFWSPLAQEQSFFEVSLAGHLADIDVTQGKRPFSMKPYAKGSYEHHQAETGNISEDDIDGGLDLRYRFLTNLTLDISYRTDFAETEVDRFQVNLTRFPLFFPEKREFFLEGKGFYDFGISRRVQPFFSRRIGLVDGDPVPILLGGKLSGKVGAYGVGTLVMETESKGDLPSERFGVLRVSRDIGLRSNAGLIATRREIRNGPHNDTIGLDSLLAPNPNLSLKGFWLSSDDASSKKKGDAYFAQVKWKDPFWRIRLSRLLIEEHFLPGLGFVRQTDLEETFGYIDIRPQPAAGFIREIGLKTEMTYQRDTSGAFLYQSNYNRIQADFRSGDFVLFSVDPQRERLPEDFEIRPGMAIPSGTYRYTHTNIIFVSDTRRPLSGDIDVLWGGFYDGTKTSLEFNLVAAPAEGLKVGGGMEIDWVRLPQGEFTAQILNADIAWSFSNLLLMQVLMQWDKEESTFATNFRLSWEYRQDSRFFLIVNPTTKKDDGDSLLVLTKITWFWEPL